MKKLLAILLAVVMVLALVACGGEKAPEPSTAPSASPSASTAPEQTGESPTAETKEYNPQNKNLSDGSASGVEVPPYSRDKYTIVYLCSSLTTQWCKDIADTLASFQEEYNFELIATDSQSQNDVYIQLVQTYADQGVDGMILNASEDYCEVCWEICNEAGVPMLFESTACIDSDGNLLTSGVELNAWGCGAGCSEWLYNHYKEYFGEIDASKAGFIPITMSSVVSFFNRSTGAKDKFLELFGKDGFPESNIFEVDLVSAGGSSAEYAYNEVAAVLAAHPEIEHWFMVPVLDMWGQGAVRAIEAALKEDVSLMCGVGGSSLITEWYAGYEGCWAACNFYEAYTFAEYLAPGICRLADGTNTPQDLWPDWKDPTGETEFSSVRISGVGVTKYEHAELVRFVTSA